MDVTPVEEEEEIVSESDLAGNLETYIKNRIPNAEALRVDQLQRIHGGASRKTYRFRLQYSVESKPLEKRLILRIDPDTSLVESDFSQEFKIYQAFFGSPVPVPEPLWLEEDVRWLGRPFFVMTEIQGCESDRTKIADSPYQAVKKQIGEYYSRILAEISKSDPTERGLSTFLDAPAPEECWRRELDYWEDKINQNELEPHPVVRAATRWLRKCPPPPAQKITVIHGDYRIGNILYSADGTIHGILDWEMCHLGDPLEDITYGMNPLWSALEPDKVGTMLPREKFIEIWEKESGLKVSPDALHWWEVFTSIKAIAIWIDAGRKFKDGRNKDIILGHTAWMATDVQSFILLNQLRNLP